MNTDKRIDDLLRLAQILNNKNSELESAIEKAHQHNNWFTKENIILSLNNILEQFLDENELLEMMNVTPTQSEAWDIVQASSGRGSKARSS